MSHAAQNDFQMPLWPDGAADPLLPIANQFLDLRFGEGLCILELQSLRRVVFVDGVTWGQVDQKQTAPASREEALQQLCDFRDLGGSPTAWRNGTPALYGLFTLKTRSAWRRTLDACCALGLGTREAVDGGLTSALIRAISQAVDRAHAHCPTGPAHVDHHRLGTQAALRARAFLVAGATGVANVAQLTKSCWPVLPLALLTSKKALVAVCRGESIYRAWLSEGYPKAQLRQWLRPSGSFPECLSRGVTDLEGMHRVLRLLGELPHQATYEDGWTLDSTMNEFGTDRETVCRWALQESRCTKALHTLLGALSTVVEFADTSWPLERLLELRPTAVVSLAAQLHQNERRCRKMMASARASWLDEVMAAFSSWADQNEPLARLGWHAPANVQEATTFARRHGFCSHNAAVVEILVLNANMLLTHPETGMQASINVLDARVVELRRPKNEHADKTTRLALQAAVTTLRSPQTETLRSRIEDVIDGLRRRQWEDALRRVDGQRSLVQDHGRHFSCQ